MKKKAVSLLIAGLMVLEPCTMAGAADFSDAEVIEQSVENAEEETAEPEETDLETEEPEETAEPEEDAEITEEAAPEEDALSLEAGAEDTEALQPEAETFDAGEESEFSDNAEEASVGTYKNEIDSGRFAEVNTLKWKVCGDSEDDEEMELVIYGSGAIPAYTSSEATPWTNYSMNIAKIIIEDGVTAVGDYAFEYFYSLKEVQLGNDVKKIGKEAFSGSSKLATINFPAQLESIGENAFSSTDLQIVRLPDTVTSVGANAFAYCSSLRDVVLSAGLTELASGVFNCANNITRIVVPASLKKAADDNFEYLGQTPYEMVVIQYTGTEAQWKALNFPLPELYSDITSVVYNFNMADVDAHIWTKTKFTDDLSAYDCTKGGTKSYHCIICGAHEETVTVAPKQHRLWETVTEAATINKAGLKSVYCYDCSYETEETIQKLTPFATLSKKPFTLNPQQKYTALSVKYAKGDSVVSWKSSNSNIVKVTKQSGGKCLVVAGKTPGKAVLTVTLKSKKTAKITVTVRAIKTTKITGVKSALTLKVKKTAVLKPVLTPRNSTEKITYRSSNAKVATVTSAGKITAKKKGTAYIYVKSGSKTVKCKVVVK